MKAVRSLIVFLGVLVVVSYALDAPLTGDDDFYSLIQSHDNVLVLFTRLSPQSEC